MSAAHAGDSFCCKYVGGIFTVIMWIGVSVAIMQVVFFAVYYACNCFYCNYAGDPFTLQLCRWQFQVTFSYSFLYLTASFHKLDQKTFREIMSGWHFTTFINILPKLRYFESRNYIQIGFKSYSVIRSRQTYESWEHLGFLQRGESQKRRSMTPLPTMNKINIVWKNTSSQWL